MSYRELFKAASSKIAGEHHIYHSPPVYQKGKGNILEVFPNTRLDLDKEERTFKLGQLGYGKYVYIKKLFSEIKTYFEGMAGEFFPEAKTSPS